MRKLQEFREPTPPEAPSGKPERGVKPEGYPGTQFMWSIGFNVDEEEPNTLCHESIPNCKIEVTRSGSGEPTYKVNNKEHDNDLSAVRAAAGPHLEKLSLKPFFKTEHFMGFKEFVENLAEKVSANNTSGVEKFDPLLSRVQKRGSISDIIRKLKTRLPSITDINPKDPNRYGSPYSDAKSQKISSAGYTGGA